MLSPILNEQLVLIIAAVAIGVAFIAIIVTFYLIRRMRKFEKAYISLQTFLSGTSLEDILKTNLHEVKELRQQVASQDTRLNLAENKLRHAIDRAELIKFNSFENMTADLSFALALLNQEGTGVLLTSIHGIEECRVYAKPIEKGQASVKLSKEEKLAIEKACQGPKI
ncbi:MAG TPA: DUF4446 family protein [Peptococcaceae bacterium]|nr:DUF4446 family protein [Peptococcaceae bacterium]